MANTEGLSTDGPALVVVHALHPLREGIHPDGPFAANLDIGADLLGQMGAGSLLYVPGSKHRAGVHVDTVSLSAAGGTYLQEERGISRDLIHGEDWNEEFKGGKGVYNAGDEVLVAAGGYEQYALNGLHAVCLASQVRRMRLHYEAYGLQPTFHTPSGQSDVLHAGMAERALTFYTRYVNRTWQKGVVPAVIRRSRLPRGEDALA